MFASVFLRNLFCSAMFFNCIVATTELSNDLELSNDFAKYEELEKVMAEEATEFGDQNKPIDSDYNADLANDPEFMMAMMMSDYQKIIMEAQKKAEQEAIEKQLREQEAKYTAHFAALSPEMRELVEVKKASLIQVFDNIRLSNTLTKLIDKIRTIPTENSNLVIELEKFAQSITNGSYVKLFFSDITAQEAQPAAQDVSTYGPTDLVRLYQALGTVSGEPVSIFKDILDALIKANYKHAAQLCYEINEAAIDATLAGLREAKSILSKELLREQYLVAGVEQNALIYFSHQITVHVNTLASLKKLAAKSSAIGISWLLYSFSQLYEIVEPYFMLHGKFRVGEVINPAHIGTTSYFFNKTKIADLVVRSTIAICAMAQTPHDKANKDLTQLIMGDSKAVRFVDPLNEGTGRILLRALVANGQTAGGTFNQPTKFATQLSGPGLFFTRFACAIAFHNLHYYWWNNNALPADLANFQNQAVGGDLNRAVLRLGIFSLQGYVTGGLQAIVYQDCWRDKLFALEEFSMGLISHNLLTEFVDLMVRSALMQHNQFVENNIVQFNEFDIHGYSDYWYLWRMYQSYKQQVPQQEWSAGDLSQYQTFNQHLFYQYRILYYIFGTVGRFWGRKATAAYIDPISTTVGKGVRSFAGWLETEDEATAAQRKALEAQGISVPPQQKQSDFLTKEGVAMMLKFKILPIMHAPESDDRKAAIHFLRSYNMIPQDEQDEQVINNQIVNMIIQFCVNAGILDYRTAYGCMMEYKKHHRNVGPFVPYLVDKIADGILICAGGFAGKYLGWKVAECFFTDPQRPLPVGGMAPALPLLARAGQVG